MIIEITLYIAMAVLNYLYMTLGEELSTEQRALYGFGSLLWLPVLLISLAIVAYLKIKRE